MGEGARETRIMITLARMPKTRTADQEDTCLAEQRIRGWWKIGLQG